MTSDLQALDPLSRLFGVESDAAGAREQLGKDRFRLCAGEGGADTEMDAAAERDVPSRGHCQINPNWSAKAMMLHPSGYKLSPLSQSGSWQPEDRYILVFCRSLKFSLTMPLRPPIGLVRQLIPN